MEIDQFEHIEIRYGIFCLNTICFGILTVKVDIICKSIYSKMDWLHVAYFVEAKCCYILFQILFVFTATFKVIVWNIGFRCFVKLYYKYKHFQCFQSSFVSILQYLIFSFSLGILQIRRMDGIQTVLLSNEYSIIQFLIFISIRIAHRAFWLLVRKPDITCQRPGRSWKILSNIIQCRMFHILIKISVMRG